MLSSRAPLWVLPRAHHGSVTALFSWASGTSTALTACVTLPEVSTPDGSGSGRGGRASRSGAPAAAGPPPPLPLPSVLPLQQLIVSGSKDGSVAVVDAGLGRMVSFMPKVHFGESHCPLAMLSRAVGMGGGSGSSAGQRHHLGTVGKAVTSAACLQDGLLTCGLHGAMRFHALSADWLA